MRLRLRASAIAASLFGMSLAFAAPALASSESQTQLQNERREVAAMHWRGGTQPLGSSHGKFSAPAGAKMITGRDAARFDDILNGTSGSDSEAIVELPHSRLLYLSYNDSGHVSVDDWKTVDTVKMLADIKTATADANEERVKNGADAMYVDGWAQKPTYDPARKSVLWTIKLHGASGAFVNAIALVLGRHGYERFTLASDGKDPAGDAAALAQTTRDYQFEKGWRFSDYVTGDKLAGYGIAALVGTAAGATLVKTGALVGILLLFKKFFILILAGLAGGFSWMRRTFFSRTKFGPPAGPAQPEPPRA
jgi:uncharacterized membrane-anchored protein